MKKLIPDFTQGYRTALLDGVLVPDSPKHMATEFFYPVSKGDYICCEDENYIFAVATFSAKREEKYLYTYDYKTDEAWVTYRQDLTPDSYSGNKYVFENDGYCRICVKRKDGGNISEEDVVKAQRSIALYYRATKYEPKTIFEEEIEDTVKKVNGHKDLLTFALLTDSHYTVNGTWDDTANNMYRVLQQVKAEGIIHLGDFTDGMTSKKVTTAYVKSMLGDLKKNELPIYVTFGNHDSNYFKGNPQRFTKEEMCQIYEVEEPFYYKDFPAQKLRALFLDSYDPNEPVRYGFSIEMIQWVEKTLDETPAGYKVIIFSHEAPMHRLDYWARLIRNGKAMMQVLESYQEKPGRQILAYIHGHTHGEHVYRGSSFPIISVGCNKCEYFPDKKPEGCVACERKPDTVTQDLWDILQIDVENERLHFVRFGAGEDRVVDCKKTESTWAAAEAESRIARSMKIWAHRGSSGFAPENTIPAFAVAKALDVDGIELDVQLTKDGEIVVIHDETIDRTSDGTGFVKDYTLEELRKFNFASNKPAFGFVTIPTLREVYGLFQDTDYTINVELKTGILPYDEEMCNGICLEKKVHDLTQEMGMTKQVIYSSFNHESVLKIQKYITEEKTAFLQRDIIVDGAVYASSHHVDAMHPAKYFANLKQYVEACHQKGLKVHVWTVNEKEEALMLREMGVDAIITNHPGSMRDLLT